MHLGDMNSLNGVKPPHEYLTEASESPGLCGASDCNCEAFPKEEKATRERQDNQPDVHGTKIFRAQGIVL